MPNVTITNNGDTPIEINAKGEDTLIIEPQQTYDVDAIDDITISETVSDQG